MVACPAPGSRRRRRSPVRSPGARPLGDPASSRCQASPSAVEGAGRATSRAHRAAGQLAGLGGTVRVDRPVGGIAAPRRSMVSSGHGLGRARRHATGGRYALGSDRPRAQHREGTGRRSSLIDLSADTVPPHHAVGRRLRPSRRLSGVDSVGGREPGASSMCSLLSLATTRPQSVRAPGRGVAHRAGGRCPVRGSARGRRADGPRPLAAGQRGRPPSRATRLEPAADVQDRPR